MRIFNLIEGVWGHKRDVGFDVERKNPPLNPLQGGEFEKIGFIEGHGNRNSPKSYEFIDKNVLCGKHY